MKFNDMILKRRPFQEGIEKDKDYYTKCFMELVKEGFDEFLYRGMAPDELVSELKERLPNVKTIQTMDEWSNSEDVKRFKYAMELVNTKDTTFASYVKEWDLDEYIGSWCYKYYDNMEQAVVAVSQIVFSEKCKLSYSNEILDTLESFVEDKDITL